MINLRQLAYGIISFLPGVPESLYRGTGNTLSAEYCYCIWLRHLTRAYDAGMRVFPETVAELGPGDSLGVGLAALLSGASRYLALDALTHADKARNLDVFDSLVDLFQCRSPIPDSSQFPEIRPDLPSHAFPSHILDSTRMRAALSIERVAWLRLLVSGQRKDSSVLDYRAPWGCLAENDIGTADFILTNAVMEHVADLPGAYEAMARWLKPGGYVSHQIDFRSHSLFGAWDGHWACPDWLWSLFIGRRPYLLNREPLDTHRQLLNVSGLQECICMRVESPPASTRLASQFREMSTEDRCTSGAYLCLRKEPAQ